MPAPRHSSRHGRPTIERCLSDPRSLALVSEKRFAYGCARLPQTCPFPLLPFKRFGNSSSRQAARFLQSADNSKSRQKLLYWKSSSATPAYARACAAIRSSCTPSPFRNERSCASIRTSSPLNPRRRSRTPALPPPARTGQDMPRLNCLVVICNAEVGI